jgi:hypothetical protein
MDPLKALESLLLKMFSVDELRRLLRYLPEGESLSKALPGPNASPAQVAHTAVEALDQMSSLYKPALWQRLAEERPNRKAEIDAVHALFAQAPAPAVPSPNPAPTPTSAASPSVLTILLASASPVEATRLRVDKEFRQIIEKLRGARHRDHLRIVQISAVRFEDLRTALMEHEPQVLHLSCHGETDGSLKFESATEDGAKGVSKKRLLKLLRPLASGLHLVVFNACHSAKIACDVPPTIGLSIGMTDEIQDAEAIEFAVAFYEALAFGKSVQTAFDIALSSFDDEDDEDNNDDDADEIPQLFPSVEQDHEKKRQQPLIAGILA